MVNSFKNQLFALKSRPAFSACLVFPVQQHSFSRAPSTQLGAERARYFCKCEVGLIWTTQGHFFSRVGLCKFPLGVDVNEVVDGGRARS